MTMTPFTFADNVLSSREDIFSEENQDQYVPFIINRHLSYFIDTVLYANDMNIYNHLEKSSQYQYLLNTIPKRKRFSKWEKKTSDQLVLGICEVFQCNEQRALEILPLLTPDHKQKIITKMGSGDDKRSTKSSRSKTKTSR
jgi:hypothetical protein